MECFTNNVPLAPLTTFKTGGSAEYFSEVHTVSELQAALASAKAAALPVTIVGGGSNVLVSDDGVSGCVIKNSITERLYTIDGVNVYATYGAGEVFDDIVAESVQRGYWGLENLSHIPGSVGATPIQNVGAYGVEVADIIERVTAVHILTGEEKTFTKNECQFSYRDSFFKTTEGRQWVVVSVTYALSVQSRPKLEYKDLAAKQFDATTVTPQNVRDAVVLIRAQKFPDWKQVGTAGSFFKNPIITNEQYQSLVEKYPELPGWPVGETQTKVPLGWILDKICGLRGTQSGLVGNYAGQALVVVAEAGAKSSDVAAYAKDIAANVLEETGISIEWEVTQIK